MWGLTGMIFRNMFCKRFWAHTATLWRIRGSGSIGGNAKGLPHKNAVLDPLIRFPLLAPTRYWGCAGNVTCCAPNSRLPNRPLGGVHNRIGLSCKCSIALIFYVQSRQFMSLTAHIRVSPVEGRLIINHQPCENTPRKSAC